MRKYKILIIGPAWVGDMVMVQSLFMALSRKNPEVTIDVVAPAWSAPILARMPEVNRIIEVNLQHGRLQFGERLRVGKSLRGQYDQAIILPRSFKSALIPYFAKVPIRTAYRGEMRYGLINDMRPLDKKIIYKAVEKFVYLSSDNTYSSSVPEIEFPCLLVDEEKRHQAAIKLNIDENIQSVGLMPGAEYGPSKRWPAEHFAQLAQLFAQDGYQVCVFGSTKDQVIGEEITQRSNGAAKNLCGKTTLEEAVDMLSLVEVAVTNDSGLMHIAAAVQRPVVALYGAITPSYTPPLTDTAEIKYLNLDCSPCWDRECRYGHYNCLKNIEVQQVYESAKKLLAS